MIHFFLAILFRGYFNPKRLQWFQVSHRGVWEGDRYRSKGHREAADIGDRTRVPFSILSALDVLACMYVKKKKGYNSGWEKGTLQHFKNKVNIFGKHI